MNKLADDIGVSGGWKKIGNVSFKGTFYQGLKIYTDSEIYEIFSSVSNESEFSSILKSVNGYYCIIVDLKSYTLAAVDHISSYKLFYYKDTHGAAILSDGMESFFDQCSINGAGMSQYLASGYVYSDETLLKGLYQLVAGSYVVINKINSNIDVRRYYEYLPDQACTEKERKTEEQYLEILHNIHLSIFQRLSNSLSGKHVVLPLSGGYDSRLILEMLLKLGCKDILCVTWGRKSDWQVKIAKSITKALGVRWVCIENSYGKWKKWKKDGLFDKYILDSNFISAIPYVQDNLLIPELKRLGLLKSNSVFLNGNSGDFIEGDHIPKDYSDYLTAHDIVRKIMGKHAALNNTVSNSEVFNRILIELQEFLSKGYEPALFYEYWEWKERQSKFVAGCVKAFEFEGYEWRMPLWDRELVDFWRNIPLDMKVSRKLYYKYHRKYLNNNIDEANPKVSAIKRYTERFFDPRFVLFFSNHFFYRCFGNTKYEYSSISQYIDGMYNYKVKFNALLALKLCEKLDEKK